LYSNVNLFKSKCYPKKWKKKLQHNPSQIIGDIAVGIPLTTISNVMDSTLTSYDPRITSVSNLKRIIQRSWQRNNMNVQEPNPSALNDLWEIYINIETNKEGISK